MPLISPNLDDRSFEALVSDAIARARSRSPEWTDFSVHDPGLVLIEAFAHITETMLYRLNRLPEKVFIELLRLINVRLRPPTAADVTVRFEASEPFAAGFVIPEGARLSVSSGERSRRVELFTVEPARFAAGTAVAEARAFAAERVLAERLGEGTDRPGLALRVGRPPIVAKTHPSLEVVVGVQAEVAELTGRARARKHEGKTFRLWTEVENFSETSDDPFVFVVDRAAGLIHFPPAARLRPAGDGLKEELVAVGTVPGKGREIRVWYPTGGGPDGNVGANTITRVESQIPGLTRGVTIRVTNPRPASGGHSVESLENAMLRGPFALRSLERAVTAADFEQLALATCRDVARARAYASAQYWAHAVPGSVDVLIVPGLKEREPAEPLGPVSLARIEAEQNETRRRELQAELDRRRPIGTRCSVKWARYTPVEVSARVVAHRGEDAEKLEERLIERLHEAINPLPTPLRPNGWGFGEPLRASAIYDLLLAEPGVAYVEGVQLALALAPSNVSALAASRSQRGLWYAASGNRVFRSVNDAESWEPVGAFDGREIRSMAVHPSLPGFLAITVDLEDAEKSRIFWSRDAGDSWEPTTHMVPRVNDLAWMVRGGVPVLLMATSTGLLEVALTQETAPLPILVDPSDQNRGFWSVSAVTSERGALSVAAAAMGQKGVFVSFNGALPGSFVLSGLMGEDVRVLEAQYDGVRSFLWAGVSAGGGDAGKGCFQCELTGLTSGQLPQWKLFGKAWQGGSCTGISFVEIEGSTLVLAGSYQAGVLTIDARKGTADWVASEVSSGLPLRQRDRLFPRIRALASAGDLVLAGMENGVYGSTNRGLRFVPVSKSERSEKVTIPENWLICSGDHKLEVTAAHETE